MPFDPHSHDSDIPPLQKNKPSWDCNTLYGGMLVYQHGNFKNIIHF